MQQAPDPMVVLNRSDAIDAVVIGDKWQAALNVVKAAGYVVLKEKSYRQAQERQRVVEALRAAEEQDAEHARAWARDCLADERRMRDRLTFVYGVARAHGASVEDLKGSTDA